MNASMVAPAYVRAYTQSPDLEPLGARKQSQSLDEPSTRVLVFDCETTTNAAQALRFGIYQIREEGILLETGLFFDPVAVPLGEQVALRTYAEKNAYRFVDVQTFRKEVMLGWAFEGNATVVGFNLPFDIARSAKDWGEARLEMRGGFSFMLSADPYAPRIRVKHLNSTTSLIDFATARAQLTARSARDRDEWTPANRGYFVDLRTIAAALTSQKHSLASLTDALKVPTQKRKTSEHGGALTTDYLDYACADVQATWECYVALVARYAVHGLSTPIHRILSEASIGKAYLKAMGIQPLFACQPDVPRPLLGVIMSTYFGGRSEVRIRKEVRQIHYCDFKSMYPTVNALMGLARFLVADGFTYSDTTSGTQTFLKQVTLEDLKTPQAWRLLTTLVKLRPQGDVLPTRTRYSEDKDTLTIGVNHVHSETPLWYALADVIASKLLTGRAPVIDEAITFAPNGVQTGLQPIRLFGREEYAIDPACEDIFSRFIDLRDEAKAKGDPIEKALKIIANATCYGIFVEVLRDDAPKPETVLVYGPEGEGFETRSTALEEPGTYFHPLLATFITGAARLMLAAAERVAADRGLDWVFCDTDSIAMAKPKDMDAETFYARAQSVVDWFIPLNPYEKSGSILKVEDINFRPGARELEPLFAWAISAKRYALFNLDAEGRPVIRKFSAHGLGHLMEPYSETDPAKGVPDPIEDVSKLGGRRWQYDFWYHILVAALEGRPNQVRRDYHPALSMPALSRYGATSPALLRWMKPLNAGKSYAEQVKPFGFMVAPMAGTPSWEDCETIVSGAPGRGRPRQNRKWKPIAPFERDPAIAASRAFDRETGEPVPVTALKTYAQALALYHVSPEDKFENGGPWDTGRTERRHLRIVGVRLIGKEANRVDETGTPDPTSAACVEFSTPNIPKQ